MPTCLQSIQSIPIDNITSITPNTLFPVSITMQHKQLYKLETTKQETVYFTLSLQSSDIVTNIGVSVNFYLVLDSQIVHLGTAAITETVMSFQKDLSPGTYLICIGSSRYSYTGTFLGVFTGFQVYSKLKPRYSSGETLSLDMTVPLPPRGECTKLKYYTIVEGSLPPGLDMNALGVIEGALPNMDCIDDNADLSPSQNWYYEIDNTWQPWGRQWRFKVRVYLFEMNDVFEEKWFCVKIHNNWSWDKDNLNSPIEYVDYSVLKANKYVLPELCCEPIKKEKVFTPINIPQLCDCDTQTPTEQVQVLNFLSWYQSNLNLSTVGPEIQKFIDEFKESDLYKSLFKKAGLEKEDELQAVKNLIAEYTNNLISGRSEDDVDFKMLNLRDKENQKLPITTLSFTGQYMEIIL